MDIYAADSDDSNEKAEDISILRWVSTTVAEIYVFLAVLIYDSTWAMIQTNASKIIELMIQKFVLAIRHIEY
ncbi:hypothetical protein E4U61_001548 [Claviceps capensis]|nr:hypothetical protein E4U61_001548 [Claviceps capensis]